MKLLKEELVKHEKKCKYNCKLQCPGCNKTIAEFNLPEHLRVCTGLLYEESWDWQQLKLNQSKNLLWSFNKICPPVLLYLNQRILRTGSFKMGEMFQQKLVFYIKHLCGEKKETFNFKLKISGEIKSFSRSISGRCAQLGMRVNNVQMKMHSLDICTDVMQEMCLVLNQGLVKDSSYERVVRKTRNRIIQSDMSSVISKHNYILTL